MALGANIHGFDEDKNVANLSNILASVADIVYPVGSIYMSTVNLAPVIEFSDGRKAQWIPWGQGRVPVGVNSSDADFNSAEIQKGSKTTNYVVPENEMPKHTHNGTLPAHNHDVEGIGIGGGVGQKSPSWFQSQADGNFVVYYEGDKNSEGQYPSTWSSGRVDDPKAKSIHQTVSLGHANPDTGKLDYTTTVAMNASTFTTNPQGYTQKALQAPTLQPYITCYMFKRVS